MSLPALFGTPQAPSPISEVIPEGNSVGIMWAEEGEEA
jgi:hypothetical protein